MGRLLATVAIAPLRATVFNQPGRLSQTYKIDQVFLGGKTAKNAFRAKVSKTRGRLGVVRLQFVRASSFSEKINKILFTSSFSLKKFFIYFFMGGSFRKNNFYFGRATFLFQSIKICRRFYFANVKLYVSSSHKFKKSLRKIRSFSGC